MRNKFLSIILLASLLLSAACTVQPSATDVPVTEAPAATAPATDVPVSTSFTVTDALDRTVQFEKIPERIVIVGKGLFMIADAIYTFPEAGAKIVAMGSPIQGKGDFISMIDENAATKITLTGDTVGAEQIATANPDLVLLKSSNEQSLGAPLEALGIPVVYIDFETPEQYNRDLATLGQIFQNEARATELAEYYQDRVDAITTVTSTLTDEQKPSVLVVYYNSKDNTIALNVPPLSWIQTTQVIDAGGDPVWKDSELGKSWTTVTIEQIAAWNPDVVFVVSYKSPVNDVVASLKADPQWSELQAVKDGKLYGFATDVYSWDQSDTRWILGLTWMAGKLHPDLFPNLDIKAEAQSFYQTLYNMDVAAFESKILPLFTGDLP